jgi:hypothetical protein
VLSTIQIHHLDFPQRRKMPRSPCFAAALVLFASGACALAPKPLPVPEALAGAEGWRVETRYNGRTARYRFGPYRVGNVRWHDVRQRGGIVDALKGKREYQERYEFAVRDSTDGDGSRETRVQCDSRDRAQGVSIGSVNFELGSGVSLECRLYAAADTSSAGMLRISARNDNAPQGIVQWGHMQFDIAGDRPRTDSDKALPRAYLVRRSGTIVAMVDRTHPGYVHLSPTLPREEQDLLAATLTALLIHRNLSDS